MGAKLCRSRRLRVFQNRLLKRIFGPKREKVTGEWRKLHKKELNDLYSSRKIVLVIKLRRMKWACMRESRGVYWVLVGKPEGRDHLGDPGIDGRIILIWIFRKWDVGAWSGLIWLRLTTCSRYL
jgi:hypothetical protein